MNNFPFLTTNQARVLLRVAISLFLMAHGMSRIYLGTVGGFGDFLNSNGFIIGSALAWCITIFELVGGAALALGYFVRWICLGFIIQLLMGIILVHAQHGWFVVGATLNGVEYSVLLIVCFITVAAWEKRKN